MVMIYKRLKSINLAVSAYFEYQIIIIYILRAYVTYVYLKYNNPSDVIESLLNLPISYHVENKISFLGLVHIFFYELYYLVVFIHKNIICNPISSFRTCAYPWLKLFSDTCAPHVIMTFLIYWAYHKVKLPCNTKDTKQLVKNTCVWHLRYSQII